MKKNIMSSSKVEFFHVSVLPGFEPRTSCTKVRYLNHKAMQEEGGCNSKLAINTTTIAVSLKMTSEAASDLGGHF